MEVPGARPAVGTNGEGDGVATRDNVILPPYKNVGRLLVGPPEGIRSGGTRR